jgi:hypothetical protein
VLQQAGRIYTGLASRKVKVMNLSLEFSREREPDLNKLLAATGTVHLKDLVNDALTMLEWAVHEVGAENEIAAVNEDKQVYRVLLMPVLERTAGIARNRVAA